MTLFSIASLCTFAATVDPVAHPSLPWFILGAAFLSGLVCAWSLAALGVSRRQAVRDEPRRRRALPTERP